MSFPQQALSAVVLAAGLIAVDEHTSLSCMIDEVTPTGLALTLPDATAVPGTFVLTVGGDARVCTVVRRDEETIEARFADIAGLGRAAAIPVHARRRLPEYRSDARPRPVAAPLRRAA